MGDAEFVDAITQKLGIITKTDPRSVAESLLFRSRRVHPHTKRREPVAKWIAAVDRLVKKLQSGWAPDEPDNLVGYIVGMVPDADVSLELKDGIAETGPKLTPEVIAYRKRMAERAAAEQHVGGAA